VDVFDPNLCDKLDKIVAAHELSCADLKLEVTESAYTENADQLVQVIEGLRSRGYQIEMDDFGTGYSSLGMLTEIPIDILKIDMSFVRSMEKHEKNKRMVELIIDIAKFLKVPCVAEGVETESQLRALRRMGCDVIQGYFFSKPVAPEDFAKFIEKEKSLWTK
jgi:EAL domain-containing protein (putative c-di-GMP-specific phosphodiesterase class I)